MRKPLLLALALLGASSLLRAQIDVDQVLNIGRNAIYFKDYIVSMGYFNQVIGLRPWMAEPYLYRSIAKISLDDYAGASADASLALERNPLLSRAYLIRGIAHLASKDYPAATKDFRQGLSLSPADQGMHHNLTLALLEEKKYQEADSAAYQMLRFSPKSREAYRFLAQSALERQDTLLAQQRLGQLLELDSIYSPAYLLRAQIAAARQDYSSSIRDLDYVIGRGSASASLYVNRAIMRYHQNDLRGAMEDYSEALRLSPSERAALNNRALLRMQVGEYSLAITDWDKLLQLEPKNHIARYNRALLLERVGRLRAALSDLNEVLRVYPIFSEGFVARAALRQRLGDTKGATQDQLHVFDLSNNARYRKQATQQAKTNSKPSKTRSETDEAIEKYGLLVETKPETGAERPSYSSQLRGRVQDVEQQLQPKQDVHLSYFTEVDKDGNQSRVFYSSLLDQLNSRLRQRDRRAPRILLEERSLQLGEKQIQALHADIRQLSELGEDQAELYLRRGIDYALLQDLDQAILDFTRALSIDPKLSIAYLARAAASVRRSQALQSRQAEPSTSTEQQLIRSAATVGGQPITVPSAPRRPSVLLEHPPLLDLNQLLQLAPGFAYGYYNRANLYLRSGEQAHALEDYNKAIELNASFAEAYFNRGLLYYALGKVAEGTRDLSRAGELGLYEAYSIIKRMNQ